MEQDLKVVKGQKTVLENEKELLQEQLRVIRDEVSEDYEKKIGDERYSFLERIEALKNEKNELSTQLSEVQQRNKELEKQLSNQSASDQANNPESLPVYEEKEGGEEASNNPPVYDDYAELQAYVNESKKEADNYYKQVNDLQYQIGNLNEELIKAQTAQKTAENK